MDYQLFKYDTSTAAALSPYLRVLREPEWRFEKKWALECFFFETTPAFAWRSKGNSPKPSVSYFAFRPRLLYRVSVKVNLSLSTAWMYRGSNRFTAPLIPYIGARWKRVFSVTFRVLCPRYRLYGWMGGYLIWSGEENKLPLPRLESRTVQPLSHVTSPIEVTCLVIVLDITQNLY